MSSDSSMKFSPLYVIKVPSATKSGETLEFLVETKRQSDTADACVVSRVYEDFAWFLHCLQSMDNVTSIIFPPLPPRPLTSISAAEKLTKKQTGSSSGGSNPGVLVGDDLGSFCAVYEEFLSLCANHPRLGHSPVLEKFLMEREAPVRVRVKRSIFDSIMKTVDDKRTGLFKDSNQDLQQVKVRNDESIKLLKAATSSHKKIVNNTFRISAAYADIQAALKELSTISTNSKVQAAYDGWCDKSADACVYASGLHKESASVGQQSVGACLQLYEGYARSQHDMLQKRIYKAIDLESAKSKFEKAKPNKKQQAEDEMKRLELELNDMTSLAVPELERYNRQRVLTWQSAMVKLCEAEIKASRDALAVFTETHHSLENLPPAAAST